MVYQVRVVDSAVKHSFVSGNFFVSGILPTLVLFQLLYISGYFNLIFIKDYMEITSYFERKGIFISHLIPELFL